MHRGLAQPSMAAPDLCQSARVACASEFGCLFVLVAKASTFWLEPCGAGLLLEPGVNECSVSLMTLRQTCLSRVLDNCGDDFHYCVLTPRTCTVRVGTLSVDKRHVRYRWSTRDWIESGPTWTAVRRDGANPVSIGRKNPAVALP